MHKGSLAPSAMPSTHDAARAKVHLVFPAVEDSVRRAMRSVRSSLRSQAFDITTIDSVEIVLAEATNNIVEHAYAGTSTGTISLACYLQSNLLHFEIIDDGRAFPNEELPAKQSHHLGGTAESLPEGGFGWGLIRDITNSLSYHRSAHRNILHFTIPITS